MACYLTPAAPVDFAEVIKNSQFITRLRCASSAEQAKDFIREMNATYPDATHHCWAYIVGDPKSTTLIGCSDDGEPSGTAGRPMLNVLQHAGIGDIVAVCTRYYGGTKLGTGGLTRAYGGGVKLALEALTLKEKVDYTRICFALDYAQQKDGEHLLKAFQTENFSQDYQSQVKISVDIATSQLADFDQALQNQFRGQIEWKTC